ncbi:hypothetical protein AAC387_Pa08g2634 [Persea americana]
MKPKSDRAISRTQKTKCVEGEGLNWVIIAGGALLSTLSFRLVCKLKQAVKTKLPDSENSVLKGNRKCTTSRRSGACLLHSNVYCFTQDEDSSYHCLSGISEGTVEMKQPPTSPMSKEMDLTLPLVTVPAPESNKENGMIWASSPERLELPRKPFHQSNGSDSPCVSESGSDIYSKREVIHKLRQQLKRRDEMILEMQAQITDLQNSLRDQLTQSTLIQSQLDSANRDLFESEREIQRLRKAIADHCVGETGSPEKPAISRNWQAEHRNGQVNGFHHNSRELELQCVGVDKRRADVERIEMLRREVGELKGLIEAKEFLLQSYKEELQLGLASQIPSIL